MEPQKPLPDPYDYSSIVKVPQTRQVVLGEHSCAICKIAKYNPVIGQSIPRHKLKEKQKKVLCGTCGSRYAPGFSHNCSSAKMAENLSKVVPLEIRQKIASSTIKETFHSSGDGATVTLKTGGSKLRVSVNPQGKDVNQISLKNVENLMNNGQLSFNQTSKVLSTIRRTLGNNCIEPNAMKQVIEQTHSEDRFFTLKSLTFQDNKGNPIAREIPIVKDIEVLLYHVYTQRNIDPFDSKVKVGIDFGGTSLKVGMAVLDWVDANDENSLPTSENFNSANKVIVLAIGNVTLVSCQIP